MAKWEDLSYAFDDPTNDSFFMTSAPPASNRFKLQPSAVPPDPPHVYQLVTVNASDVAPFWNGLKLLPQEGEPLKVKAGLKTVAERLADANERSRTARACFSASWDSCP